MTPLQEKYLHTQGYGLWKVTTEGDCEGRSIRDLGMHEGFLDEIAFALADKAYYNLKFTLVADDDKLDPSKNYKAVISLPYDVALNRAFEEQLIAAMLSKREVTVSRSSYGTELLSGDSPEVIAAHQKEAMRQQALAKLSDEERVALGL